MSMTNNHNHSLIKGFMTAETRKKFDEFITSEMRRIESALSEISQNIAEESRADIPENWVDCEECEDRVLDSYDMAYGFLCREFAKALENHL